MKKHSSSVLNCGLDLDQLERFLRFTLPRYCTDVELATMSTETFDGLARRCSSNGPDARCNDLMNAATVMDTFIRVSPALPISVVFETHSLIGLTRESVGEYTMSTLAFMKALWIASSAPEEVIRPLFLAVTLHRLGRAYGLSGNSEEAKYLLLKACDHYNRANVGKDHPCLLDAKNELDVYEGRCAKAAPERSSLPPKIKRLSLIEEEPELSHERRLSY